MTCHQSLWAFRFFFGAVKFKIKFKLQVEVEVQANTNAKRKRDREPERDRDTRLSFPYRVLGFFAPGVVAYWVPLMIVEPVHVTLTGSTATMSIAQPDPAPISRGTARHMHRLNDTSGQGYSVPNNKGANRGFKRVRLLE